MIANRWIASGTVLLTGATGLVGHHLLAELLGRGLRVAVLVRGDDAVDRLRALLEPLEVSVDRAIAGGQLVRLEGDLNEPIDVTPPWPIDDVVHAAACTRFDADAAGDPYRTNVEGTTRLLDWTIANGVRSFHFVSTAYVCGRTDAPVPEMVNSIRPDMHNDYEASKWEAEQRCLVWRRRTGGSLTIYRPSIVVGAFGSGRTTKYDGLYFSARALRLLSAMHEGRPRGDRLALSLRLRGRAHDRQNIVPVDYVARMMAEAIVRPVLHGRVYHLVHPDPPTNDQISRAFHHYYDLGGSRWVAPERFDATALNPSERLFYKTSRPIRHYFTDTPTFARHNAAMLERTCHLSCPRYSQGSLMRLLTFAERADWGRRRGQTPIAGPDADLVDYFERYLPEHVARSEIARMAALTATIRFHVRDVVGGSWVCRFVEGRLVEVTRRGDEASVDFGYSADAAVYREVITGRLDPQIVFLKGDADVTGDIESALKMSFILHAFNREFPYPAGAASAASEASCRTV